MTAGYSTQSRATSFLSAVGHIVSGFSLPSRGPVTDPTRGSGQAARKRSSQDGPTITGPGVLCSTQKRRRIQANTRPEIHQLVPGSPSFQDGGTVYTAYTVVQQEWVLGKVDLKDAYLTNQ